MDAAGEISIYITAARPLPSVIIHVDNNFPLVHYVLSSTVSGYGNIYANLSQFWSEAIFNQC